MAISFVAVAGNPGGSNQNDPTGDGDGSQQGSIIVDIPVGTAEGDIMFGFVSKDGTTGAFTLPSGWTSLDNDGEPAVGLETTLSHKTAGASEPSDYTWTSSNNDYMCACIVTWSGQESTPTITWAESQTSSGTSGSAPSITPGDGAGLTIYGAFDGGDGKPASGPGGSPTYTERADMKDHPFTTFGHAAACYTAIHGSGATGTKTVSWSADDGQNYYHVGIDAAAAGGAFTLTADAGSYLWSGADANLEHHSVIAAAAAGYAWSGNDATLSVAIKLTAEAGGFAWTGLDASLLYDSRLSAEAAGFAWTGLDATLTHTVPGVFVLTAEAGGYLWTGLDATLTFSGVGAPAAPEVDTGRNAGGGVPWWDDGWFLPPHRKKKKEERITEPLLEALEEAKQELNSARAIGLVQQDREQINAIRGRMGGLTRSINNLERMAHVAERIEADKIKQRIREIVEKYRELRQKIVDLQNAILEIERRAQRRIEIIRQDELSVIRMIQQIEEQDILPYYVRYLGGPHGYKH